MGESEFYESSVKYLFYRIEAHDQQRYSDYKTQWEIARWQSWVSLWPHDSGNKLTSPAKILPLPWETEVTGVNEHNYPALKAELDKMAAEEWGTT